MRNAECRGRASEN